MFLNFLFYYLIFIGSDFILNKYFDGVYYLLHCITNFIVVYYTFIPFINLYIDFNYYSSLPVDVNSSVSIISALHSYHITSYFNKLRRDDWIHHLLMVFICIPLGIFINKGYIMLHALFFINGLPGGIDYLLLFLVRNNIIERLTEKRINTLLNVWIRCPGCLITSAMIIITAQSMQSWYSILFNFIIASSIYWNGLYFMKGVVENYVYEKYLLSIKIN